MTYQEKKDKAVEEVLEILRYMSENSYSYSELYEIQSYLTKLGRRYGLLTILRENAII